MLSFPKPIRGSALLLVDHSGAVTVELNPGGPVIGEVRQAEAVARSNHPVLPASNATFGGSRRARVDSERRLEALQRQLAKRAEEASSQFDAAAALSVLRRAKKVRNLSTLAIISLNLTEGQIVVELQPQMLRSMQPCSAFLFPQGSESAKKFLPPKLLAFQ
eukprot:g10442.t1